MTSATSGGQLILHRHVDRSDAATHEDRRVVLPAQSLENRKTRLRNRTDARQHDLTAVGVSRKHRGYVQLRCFGQTPRVVREQQHGVAALSRSTLLDL